MEQKALNKWITVGIWILMLFIYIPVPAFVGTAIASLLFLLSLFSMNNDSRGFALMCFSAPVFAALFVLLHIPFTAYILCIVFGLYFLRNSIQFRLNSDGKVLIGFAILVAIFLLSFIYGPQHAYSKSKLMDIIIIGAVSILYWKVFMESSNIEIEKLAQFLCLIALFHMFFAFDFYHLSRPEGLFDFNFFRNSYVLAVKETDMIMDYHALGVSAMMGIAFMLSSSKLSQLKSKWNVLLWLPMILILLISQARQAIFGTVLLLFIRIFLDADFSFNKKSIYAIGIFLGAVVLIGVVQSDAIEKSLQATSLEASLNRDYSRSFDIISESPFFGKGVGGYSITGERQYPHNFLLELLCELGVIGTAIVLLFVFVPVLLNFKCLKRITPSHFYLFPLLGAVFIRYMMSSDLSQSIVLFTGFLVLTNSEQKAADL